MRIEIRLRKEMFGRVDYWLRTKGLFTPGSHLDERCTELESVKDELDAAATGQESGQRGFRQESIRRAVASAVLQEWMADVARVARSLPLPEFAGVAERFRMPRSQSYMAQRCSAVAFITVLRTMKDTFLERGFEPDFIERAEAMIADIETAHRAKISSYQARVKNTAALMLRSSHGLSIVREFDAVLQRTLRSNPALLAEWNSVRRVPRRSNKTAAQPAEPAPAIAPPEVTTETHANNTTRPAPPAPPTDADFISEAHALEPTNAITAVPS